MTGSDQSNKSQNQTPRAGNVVLYSLIALFAAIAGFLTVTILDRFGGLVFESNAEQSRQVDVAAANGEAVKAPGGDGFEKLVRADEPGPVPAITFTDGDGKEQTLSDWRGQVLLVNLWATWCAPCKVEMPSLDRLQAKLGGPDFKVLPISLDWSGPEKPRTFLEREKLTNLPLYLDNTRGIMNKVGATGLPLSILIDREGREIARLAGAAEWDSAEAEALIRKAIDGKFGS